MLLNLLMVKKKVCETEFHSGLVILRDLGDQGMITESFWDESTQSWL